ncbi:MAG: alpha/beta fold hydrolase [Bacillota bacterium]
MGRITCKLANKAHRRASRKKNAFSEEEEKGTVIKQALVAGAPTYLLLPEGSQNSAVVLHGYGGVKEEVLGLGLAAAAAGYAVCVPDLPGHGAHPGMLTGGSIREFAAGLRSAGFTAAVGHSLGGLVAAVLGTAVLCLLSVPLEARFAGGKSELLRVLRARRVREKKPYAGLEEAFAALGGPWPGPPVLLLHAVRDLPVCLAAAARGKETGWEVRAIRGAGHLDIVTAPETLSAVASWLKKGDSFQR